jgi:hypothetical protein
MRNKSYIDKWRRSFSINPTKIKILKKNGIFFKMVLNYTKILKRSLNLYNTSFDNDYI